MIHAWMDNRYSEFDQYLYIFKIIKTDPIFFKATKSILLNNPFKAKNRKTFRNFFLFRKRRTKSEIEHGQDKRPIR